MRKGLLFFVLLLANFYVFSQDAKAFFGLGINELQNENLHSAISYFDKAIASDNRFVDAYALRGFANGQLKNFKEAIRDFNSIISIDPSNSTAYNRRAICNKELGNYKEALKDYNTAIQLNGENADAYNNRANLKYHFLNDEEGACEDWSTSESMGLELAGQNKKGKCEEVDGFIRTENGVLIYSNMENNYHTFELEGDLDLSNYPFIRLNEIWFQFLIEKKESFVSGGRNPLLNYMNWEVEYIEEQFGKKIKIDNHFDKINGLEANYWNHENPKFDPTSKDPQVAKIYFCDIIKNDLIYRFYLPSPLNDDENAKRQLNDLVNKLTFYEEKIDLDRLSRNVERGQNSY